MLSIETSRLRVFPLPLAQLRLWEYEIGRASCRERV